jgi:hypothetical protein
VAGEHPVQRTGDNRGRLEPPAPVATPVHQRLGSRGSLPPGGGEKWESTGYVKALSETESKNGWRVHKATGSCLIHVTSGEVVLRGLECFAGHAFVGLSQRWAAVFGGLPLRDSHQVLLCGLVFVDLATGALRELLRFHWALDEVFSVLVVLAAFNQEMNRTDIDSEHNQPTCLGPPDAT